MRVATKPWTPSRHRPRGAAAVEFALILPLLITLLLGATDFGRFAYNYIAVTNAARAGASYGSMNPYNSTTQSAWQGQVQQAAIDEMTNQTGFNQGQLTVTSSMTVEAGGLKRVQVVAAYPFQPIISWPGLPGTVTLQRTVVLRVIR